jgi:RNA polymerase sigma-70 factor (ECF subfamily)
MTPDEPEYEVIYEKMRAMARRLFGYQDGYEDVVQISMEQFLKARKSFRGEGSLLAFAQGITANVARNYMRKQRRGVLMHEVVADRTDWPDLTPGPEEKAADRDKLRRLVEILERLKPKYRIAYLLYHVDNRTVPEIAGMEGTSEGAIRQRILRARREIHRRARKDAVLAEWLEGFQGDDDVR